MSSFLTMMSEDKAGKRGNIQPNIPSQQESKGSGGIATTIQLTLKGCQAALQELLELLPSEDGQYSLPRGSKEFLQDELGRLRMWAANTGVNEPSPESLDSRLRNAPHLREQILGILSLLKATAGDVNELSKANKQREDVVNQEILSTDTEVTMAYKTITALVGDLHQLSIATCRPTRRLPAEAVKEARTISLGTLDTDPFEIVVAVLPFLMYKTDRCIYNAPVDLASKKSQAVRPTVYQNLEQQFSSLAIHLQSIFPNLPYLRELSKSWSLIIDWQKRKDHSLDSPIKSFQGVNKYRVESYVWSILQCLEFAIDGNLFTVISSNTASKTCFPKLIALKSFLEQASKMETLGLLLESYYSFEFSKDALDDKFFATLQLYNSRIEHFGHDQRKLTSPQDRALHIGDATDQFSPPNLHRMPGERGATFDAKGLHDALTDVNLDKSDKVTAPEAHARDSPPISDVVRGKRPQTDDA